MHSPGVLHSAVLILISSPVPRWLPRSVRCALSTGTRNNFFLKLTFLCSLFFLIAGSLGNLVVPVALKYAIDQMSPPDPHFPLWPILLYGIASFMATFFDQLRDILFAYVSANTERLVALETFEHLQSLSLQFHLKRETGSVLRSVSRGASSFAGLLRIVLFQIVPSVALRCCYNYTCANITRL